MSFLVDALVVESRKARSSRVLWWTGALFVIGVTGLAAMMVAAARSGDTEVVAKIGPQAATGDWAALLTVAAQITAAAGVLAFGVGISALVGREFADGTIAGLFGLPVSRSAIAAAKLVVFIGWAVGVAVALTVLLLAAGVAIGLGAPDTDVIAGLGRQLALIIMTCLIAVPAGWAASVGRGLLPGIAVTVGILVIAQVSVLADFAPWVPIVAPAFWAIHPEAGTSITLVTVPSVPLIFAAATIVCWRRLQLDR
jgi:ABC-2 type transport system permease protein